MLDAFPIYHWFHNGNPYSGAEGGMRYVITPGKKADPWSIEHTAEEKIESAEFDGSQAGLDAAVAWLQERYRSEAARWENIPSILDCEPDR